MNIHQMNGLETLKQIVDGKLPGPSMAASIPMTIADVEEGAVVFTAKAGEMHLNPMGGVHGGFAATVLDSAAGCAVHTMLGPGDSYGTIDLAIKMMRPVPKDTVLYARGKVINISSRLGISEARLTDADGKLYAHATSTCMIIRNKQKQPVAELKSA